MINESVFQEFYDRTKQGLWLYLVKTTRDEAAAKDIFQDSYVRFIQAASNDVAETKMKSYLYQIATNLMRDHWRAVKRRRLWFVPSTEHEEYASPAHLAVTSDAKMDISRAFASLSPRERSVLWLAYAEGYNHKEIAELLELREKSIRVLLFRAKKKAAAVLSSLGYSHEVTL